MPVANNFDVLGKLGIARWSVDADATASDGTTTISASASDDGTDPVLGFGAQFNSNEFSVRAEFERYSNVADSDIDIVSVSAIYRY